MPPALTLDCVLIVGVSLLGGLLPLATILNHTRLQVYLSFSAGSMLGAAFFHMLPDAVRMGTPETVRWAALGLLTLFFLERFFSFHHHESPARVAQTEEARPHEHEHSRDHDHRHGHGRVDSQIGALSWGTTTFGLAIHSLVGGVALASAIKADYAERGGIGPTGWGVFLATFIHKPADALTIVSLMLGSGLSRRLAHVFNAGFALMLPLGVALFILGLGHLGPLDAARWTALALSFSAGTFLCIALSDILPELQFHAHDRLKLSTALVAGFLLMAGTSMLEVS